MRVLNFFGDPCLDGFFDSFSQVALFAAESFDGFESQLFFQDIYLCAGALDVVPISKSHYAWLCLPV
jgi:hypothetical protein